MTMDRIRRCHGRAIAAAVPVVIGLATQAMAETKPTYDKRIEEAAIRMLIPKLGDMRGALEPKSNEYLRPLANQRVIESPQAAMIPTPVERPRAPESHLTVKDRKDFTVRQWLKDTPATIAVPATRRPKVNQDRAAKRSEPATSRRNEGSFLFF